MSAVKDHGWKFAPIKGQFHPVGSSAIEKISQAVGLRLPDEYVDFLQSIGRCSFVGDAFVDAIDRRATYVDCMFGESQENAGSILNELAGNPDYGKEKLLPIARDDYNNRFVLDLVGGKVFFIDFDRRPLKAELVAESFGDFLERLKIREDD